jgi:aryl-alcohol dehydrogenase-like predicted oxidoreductase
MDLSASTSTRPKNQPAGSRSSPGATAACATLLKAGKIRAVGVSNFSVAQLEEWRATGVPLHSDQPPFSGDEYRGRSHQASSHLRSAD